MLTIKQEKFVQNIIKGMSQRQAYRNAYPDDKSNDETVDSKACRMLKENVKVRARYEELKEKTIDESIMNAKLRMKWLSDIINDIEKEKISIHKTDKDGNDIVEIKEYIPELKTKLKAMDQLNKMTGEYTTKIEGSLNVSYEDALRKVSQENEY